MGSQIRLKKMDQVYLTTKEVAEILRMHPETIRRKARQGLIPHVSCMRKIRIPKSFVETAAIDD
jgi:excisionase family DNA binding protein